MNRIEKVAIVTMGVVATFIVLRHADRAMHASIPTDMPADAQFVQSGYDVSLNEARGEWIACQANLAEGDDWCRVTDQRGVVVFQGGFLPVDSGEPVPQSQLRVSATDPSRLWVQGPFEAGPVPVIPLLNGKVLVPETDQQALASRWSRDPAEFRNVVSAQ